MECTVGKAARDRGGFSLLKPRPDAVVYCSTTPGNGGDHD